MNPPRPPVALVLLALAAMIVAIFVTTGSNSIQATRSFPKALSRSHPSGKRGLTSRSRVNALSRPNLDSHPGNQLSQKMTNSRPSSLIVQPQFNLRRTQLDVRSVKARDGILGVGPVELILTLGVATALVGPQGMVQAAKSVAQFVRSLQPAIRELAASSSEITETINKELGLAEITDTILTAQRELQSAQDDLQATIREAALGAPPPPPPPPPPYPTAINDEKGVKEEEGVKELTPEDIEELKKPNLWNPSTPQEEADAIESAEESATKLDGEAVFKKAVALAEQQQQAQQTEQLQKQAEEILHQKQLKQEQANAEVEASGVEDAAAHIKASTKEE